MSRISQPKPQIALATILVAVVVTALSASSIVWWGGTGSAEPPEPLALAELPVDAEPASASPARQLVESSRESEQITADRTQPDREPSPTPARDADLINGPGADEIDNGAEPELALETPTQVPAAQPTPKATPTVAAPAEVPTVQPTPEPTPTTETPTPTPTPEVEEEDFPDDVPLPSAPSFNEIIGSPTSPADPVEPVPTPEPTPLVLELVEGVEPPAEEPPPEPPVDVPPAPLHGGPGGLVGNAYGCELQCITRATLTNHPIHPSIAFSMRTNVDTHKALWVLPNGPFLVGGHPANFGHLPTAFDPTTMDTDWDYTVTGLEPDQTYRIIVAATDDRETIRYASTLFTTSAPGPDQLVSKGSPCTFTCIDSAIVTPGPTFDVATIAIEANVDVTFDVAVSTSPPVNVLGNPDLANEVAISGLVETATSFSGQLVGLDPSTTYYVVARAVDEEGAKQYAVGEFQTLPVPEPVEPVEPDPITTEVLMKVERAHITQTGDIIGKGEIGFRYGFEGTTYQWHQAATKTGEGESVHLGGGAFLELPLGGQLPRLIVNAYEMDSGDVSPCHGIESAALKTIGGWDHCNHDVSVVDRGGLTLDFIQSLPQCGDLMNYGLPNDRCLILNTEVIGIESVGFDVLIVFRVTI